MPEFALRDDKVVRDDKGELLVIPEGLSPFDQETYILLNGHTCERLFNAEAPNICWWCDRPLVDNA